MTRHTGFPTATRDLITTRSGGFCEVMAPGCTGHAREIHHRRPRGMGGTRRPDTNIASAGLHVCHACHRHLETVERRLAYLRGWLVRQHHSPRDRSVWYRGVSRVFLTDDGGIATAPEEEAS